MLHLRLFEVKYSPGLQWPLNDQTLITFTCFTPSETEPLNCEFQGLVNYALVNSML